VKQNKLEINPNEPEILDPWSLYIYAMKAPMTRDRYKTRLAKFFDFIGLELGVKEIGQRAEVFAKRGKENSNWVLVKSGQYFYSKIYIYSVIPPCSTHLNDDIQIRL
jgi:hypothetical protein